MLQIITDDPRWAQIVARDREADGQFWYAVATTGVYCRPSCPSRAANPENVSIYDTLGAAQATGFRACKRCNPDGLSVRGENVLLIEKACRLIEDAEEAPSLAALAEAVELSPFYFQRLFKGVTGVTPKAYAKARRREHAQHRGGKNEVLHFAIGHCSLGAILVASSARGVAAILIGDDAEELLRDLQDRFRNAQLIGADAGYENLVAKVIGHIEAPHIDLDLPLDIRGTAFQHRVWQALREIPAGQTASYSEIAARIGAAGGSRAVAGACAANSHAVAIPCHRVVRSDGALSGYRWGVERKRELLERERG